MRANFSAASSVASGRTIVLFFVDVDAEAAAASSAERVSAAAAAAAKIESRVELFSSSGGGKLDRSAAENEATWFRHRRRCGQRWAASSSSSGCGVSEAS